MLMHPLGQSLSFMHPFAAAEIQFAAHEIRCRRPQFYTPLEYDSSATSNNGTAIYAAQFAVAYTGKINRKTSNTSINYQLDMLCLVTPKKVMDYVRILQSKLNFLAMYATLVGPNGISFSIC